MPPQVRPNVLRMRPYSPGKPIDEVRREIGVHPIIKLASNENPWGPSPLALEAVRREASQLHLYPDGAAFELRRALSKFHGVPYECIACGAGSDELIHLIGLSIIDSPDDEIVTVEPSFVRYDAVAQLSPCKLVKVPLGAGFTFDVASITKAFNNKTKLVFLANPNNPTGTSLSREGIEEILDALPGKATLILDEAYFEFARAADPAHPSSIEFLNRGNVVGLRTFSKAYGLAGLRIGYGFLPEWLLAGVERARAPFHINSLALAAGVAALQDSEHLRLTLDGTRSGLIRLESAFRKAGWTTYPSAANFLLAQQGSNARPIYERLLEQGVIVRPGDVLGVPNALRVSVGTDAEIAAFEIAFEIATREAVTA